MSGPGVGRVSGRGPGGGGHLSHAPGQGLGPRGHEGHHPPVHLHTPLLSARHLSPRCGEVPVRTDVSRHVRHVLWQGHGAGARVLEVLRQTLARVTSLHALLFGMKIIYLILQKRWWLNNVYDKILYKLIPEEISYAEAECIHLEKYTFQSMDR